MRVYTYPGYVSLGSAQGGSPKLFRYLEKERGVKFEGHAWHGTLDSLPKKPAMVRASSMMKCDSYDLAKRCAELGHFCFYDDRVILPNGEYVGGDTLIEEAKKFLENYKDEPDVAREQTISYLLSTAADRSTDGETTHAMKQAKMLLDLFRAHVLREDVTPSPAIGGEYRAVRVSILEHPSTWGSEEDDTAGLDVKGMEEIGRQLGEDNEKASGLPYDWPISQAYFRKLAAGLERNLMQLDLAHKTTEIGYVMSEHQPSLGVLLATFRGRHSQWSGVAFLRRLMDAMLPALIERLVALGYPESNEVVEWEYETQNHS